VLIIEGETGSGKTTQIPQYLHEAVCTSLYMWPLTCNTGSLKILTGCGITVETLKTGCLIQGRIQVRLYYYDCSHKLEYPWKLNLDRTFLPFHPFAATCKGVACSSRFPHLEKLSLKFSSSSFPIRVNFLHLVPLWFSIVSLMFSCLGKLLLSSLLQLKGNFVRGQNNSTCMR